MDDYQESIPSLVNGYTILEEIGHGAAGTVRLALRENQEKCCVKIIPKANLEFEQDIRFFHAEIDALSNTFHPNIVQFNEMYEDNVNYYVFQEYCQGISLTQYIDEKPILNEGEGAKIFQQLLLALSYLHDRNIAHRDIKPDNIMICEGGQVKLIDFGLCTNCGDSLRNTFCGSPLYAAPECIRSEPYIAMKSDIWSAGVVFFVLITGEYPWNISNMVQMMKQIVDGFYIVPKNVSRSCSNVIKSMLNIDPNKRPSARDILSSSDFRLLIPVCPRPRHSCNTQLPKLVKKPICIHERRNSNPNFSYNCGNKTNLNSPDSTNGKNINSTTTRNISSPIEPPQLLKLSPRRKSMQKSNSLNNYSPRRSFYHSPLKS
ncbi:CAMK family protein kinase [Tritrichomonas foetus]|uniref:CAMK family protein kinase n=1 Tax=Tritrichomonas foetus TaxID=1144522 RepID=A0A1J4K9J3_9EUKA|nr:CAMK family protein kinase [Tritrichomonas foetus]|eukprot:OHT06117.1 CAMK family protein kinase [Tritrichomonas foetus]